MGLGEVIEEQFAEHTNVLWTLINHLIVHLMVDHDYTADEAAVRVGVDRSHVDDVMDTYAGLQADLWALDGKEVTK